MNKPNDDIVLRATGVAKVYEEGDLRTGVLSNVNFALRRGETLAIVGASGSGKSTLLHIIGGLDTLSAGKVEVNGRVLSELSDAERGREVGKHALLFCGPPASDQRAWQVVA